MYDNSAIEPYKIRDLGQQYNTGEKLTIILYNYINRHAGKSNKNKDRRHDMLGLQLNLLHYIKDRMGIDEGDLQA